MSNFKPKFRYLNPYEMHKIIINDYVLKAPGDTKVFTRDTSKDKTDYHVIKENHRFLWDKDSQPQSWEEEFAKKYYEKLFKEYCLADLSLYKENKVALRWRIEKEVISGKGQFVCGNKKCNKNEDLSSWEVNFAYQELGKKKNALVKLRLCPFCSKKLNYKSKKREVKRLQRKTRDTEENHNKEDDTDKPKEHINDLDPHPSTSNTDMLEKSPWEKHQQVEVKSREEEMEDYLQNLLL